MAAKKDTPNTAYVATADFEMRVTEATGLKATRKFSAGDTFTLPANWTEDPTFAERFREPRPAFRESYAIEYRDENGRIKQELTSRVVLVPVRLVEVEKVE